MSSLCQNFFASVSFLQVGDIKNNLIWHELLTSAPGAPELGAFEFLGAPELVEFEPFEESAGVASLDKEEPGEADVFLWEEASHAGLVHEVAAVAVGEVAFGVAGGVLGVHASAEDGFEFVRAVGVEVCGGEAGAKVEPGAYEAAVVFDFVAADE